MDAGPWFIAFLIGCCKSLPQGTLSYEIRAFFRRGPYGPGHRRGGRWPLLRDVETAPVELGRNGRGNARRFLIRPEISRGHSRSGKFPAPDRAKPLFQQAF
jgi:hypothetical protein